MRFTKLFQATALSLAATFVTTANIKAASTYYFSALGNDSTGNGSLARPWRTIDRFNSLDLNPGDNVYFRAGDTFTGKMWLDANDAGTNSSGQLIAPVRIGSYGSNAAAARAKIVSPYNGEAFVAYNAGGVELADLEFVSGGFSSAGRTDGVRFLSDRSATASLSKFSHVRVNNVTSSGFGLNGLQVWAHETVGYNDVQVTNSEFFNNGYSGIYLGSSRYQEKHHSNVLVDRVAAHNNPGFVGDLPITGHGVILANLDGGLLQNSVAYDNGKVNGNANVALWTYQSNAVTIQNNLAFGNRSPGGYDGGAYDCDGGATNCVVQYNRSWDNDGAGLLLAEYQATNPMGRNVFRYNLSVNDGRDGYGGITIVGNSTPSSTAGTPGPAQNTVFHNNTIVVDKDVVPNALGAVWFNSSHHRDLDFFNNVFVALNGAALIAGDTSTAKSEFKGNAYWTDGGPIILEDTTYSSVASWSNSTRQERLLGAFGGIVADPQFSDLVNYRPSADSPLVDALATTNISSWPSWYTNRGIEDLVGTPLYQGARNDLGAWEYLSGDFDFDGDVDNNDYSVLLGNWSATAYTTWRDHYGIGMNSSALVAAVPEPSALLLLLGLAPMRRWKRPLAA